MWWQKKTFLWSRREDKGGNREEARNYQITGSAVFRFPLVAAYFFFFKIFSNFI
jgi:hypothetical protein